MKWRSSRRSSNVDDLRGKRSRRGGMKIGGLGLVVIFVVGLLLGEDPIRLLGLVTSSNQQATPSSQGNQLAESDDAAEFVSTMLASNEDFWNKQLPKQTGIGYREPRLTLFSSSIDSACGMASAASGPFYCPANKRVYIDLTFFHELKQMGAPGDFAQAYVIGHEIGHHVQNLMGTSNEISRIQNKVSRNKANQLSVLIELQADCYAGACAHHSEKSKRWLEDGDLEEGIRAAATIGDDQLQRSAGRHVNPDAFTHGTSKQRRHWLTIGLKYGDMKKCDTFSALK